MTDDRMWEPKKAAPLRQPFYLSQINSIQSNNLTNPPNPRLNDFSWAGNHPKKPVQTIPFSLKYLSASNAAIQPLPAAVTA